MLGVLGSKFKGLGVGLHGLLGSCLGVSNRPYKHFLSHVEVHLTLPPPPQCDQLLSQSQVWYEDVFWAGARAYLEAQGT